MTAGQGASYLLRSDCTVWSWGNQYYGRLGNGSGSDTPAGPAPIGGIAQVVRIAAGWFHALALDRQGRLFAWGSNMHDQAGLGGPVASASTPVQIPGLARPVIDMAAGAQHSLAVDDQGIVWAWGDNAFGQLGVVGVAVATAPVRVVGPAGFPRIVAVAAGGVHSLALGDDGSVWAWGNNDLGQLGRGSGAAATTSSEVPVRVALTLVAGVRVVAIGAASGDPWNAVMPTGGTSFVVLSDGHLMSWGDGLGGMLGRNLDWSPTPGTVAGLTGAAAVSGNIDHVVVRLADGQARSFGSNTFGMLGIGSSGGGSTYAPQVVLRATTSAPVALTGATAVTAGGQHSLAVLTDGRVVCWGLNYNSVDENCGLFSPGVDNYPAAVVVPAVQAR